MPDMIIVGTLKRGETYSVDIALANSSGEPVVLDLDVDEVSAQIRREDGTFLANATVADTVTAGTYIVSFAGSTQNWPLETVYTDIRAVVGSKVVKSKPSIGVTIIRDETRG